MTINRDVIRSTSNQRVKDVRRLKQRKHRDATGLFVIEGEKLIRDALRQHNKTLEILELWVVDEKLITSCELVDTASALVANISVVVVTEQVMNSLASLNTTSPFLAIIKYKGSSSLDNEQLMFRVKQVLSQPNAANLVFLLTGIQDPGNLGTIIRIADAAGFAAVLTTKGTVDSGNDKVIRASMGSLFRVPVLYGDAKILLQSLKECNYQIWAADMDGEVYHEATLNFSKDTNSKGIAIMLGNEGQGIEQQLLQYVDKKITIPMPGRAESLNVSVAAGVLAFDLLRRL